MKPLIAGALLAVGALAGAGVAVWAQPPPPEPETVYVEVPGPVVDSGSCEEGFVLAVDFIHYSLVDMEALGLAVYNVNDESLTPLADWFPSYDSMKEIVDQAAAQECAK